MMELSPTCPHSKTSSLSLLTVTPIKCEEDKIDTTPNAFNLADVNRKGKNKEESVPKDKSKTKETTQKNKKNDISKFKICSITDFQIK